MYIKFYYHFQCVKAKNIDGSGSATLSMAYSCARFVYSLCRAKRGDKNIVEPAYIRSNCHPDVKYLATPTLLGPAGVEGNFGIPKLNSYEEKLLDKAVKDLKGKYSK